MKTPCLIALLMAGAVSVGGGAGPGDYARANEAYAAERFAEAKALYEAVAASGQASANLFYNLGNTEYRLGFSGWAILNYERALRLEPRHPEARANLAFLRERTGAKLPESSWWERLLTPLAGDAAALLIAVAAWGCLFVLVAGRPRGRRFWLLGVLVAMGAAAGAAEWLAGGRGGEALVTAEQAQARVEPLAGAALAAQLPAGSHLRILQNHGPWLYCELPDRHRAWIAAEAVTAVGGAPR